MKPKGRKFRIRRSDGNPPSDDGQRAQSALEPGDDEDGFGDMRFAGADPGAPPAGAPADVPAEQELAAIRQEGLTGRQLRMARRTAQKHGLNPASDFDAVRLLRRQGVDPFERANMLELVVDESGLRQDRQRLPATVRSAAPPAPAAPTDLAQRPVTPPPVDEAMRAQEIMRVQRDIARRRRRRLATLVARLGFFVALPTFLAGYYYYGVATPMFATNSEFVIQKAEGSSVGGGIGSLFSGTTFATTQDSISVQSFLESREAMLRLDAEHGFREHFSSPQLDPLQRLDPDATIEQAFRVYQRNLNIGYDPTEGLIRMEVIAADPEVSARFSQALIAYAEDRVDAMSQRVREDQMAGARESYEDAEANVIASQQRVIQLQEQSGVLSSEAEVGALFQQISAFEIQLQEERLRLAELQANARPNQTRVEVAERNIARLEALVDELRSSMTEGQASEASLARISSEQVVAEADLQTRQLMLAQALQQLESARIEANRQSLYLSVGVNPVSPDEAAYPRAMENTLLAFLIFSGVYLMVSMTASILREQVSS